MTATDDARDSSSLGDELRERIAELELQGQAASTLRFVLDRVGEYVNTVPRYGLVEIVAATLESYVQLNGDDDLYKLAFHVRRIGGVT